MVVRRDMKEREGWLDVVIFMLHFNHCGSVGQLDEEEDDDWEE